jgi:Tfp pilus assembly PilM family ATPase
MPFLSIEFGKHQFKVLLLEREKDTLVVRHDLALIIPPEFIKSKIPEALKDFIRRYDVTDRKVFLILSDPGVITLKNAIFPLMPPAELVGAITWHAKEDGVLTEDVTLFNYEAVKEFEDSDGAKKIAVTFSAVNRKLLEDSIRMLNRIGLEVLHVSASPLNTPKILAAMGDNLRSRMVLHLGYSSSTCMIYKKGKLLFIRHLSFSYEKTRMSLNDPLFLGTKFRTPEAEAEIERAILTIGIPSEAELSTPGGENRPAQFLGLTRPLLEGLVREMRYSMTYFMHNLSEEKPVALFLTGHGTKFRGMDLFLGRELEMPVSSLKLPPMVRCDEAAIVSDPVRLSQCISAVAGVLPGEKGADFMPFELKKQKFEAFQRSILKMASLVVVGICSLSFIFSNLHGVFLRDRLKLGEKELLAFGTFTQASEKPFPKYYLMRELEKATIPPDKVLCLVGHLMPGGLAVRHFEVESDSRSMVVDIETSGLDEGGNPMVEDLLGRLRETGFFKKIDVKPVTGYSVSVYRIEGVFRND